MGGSPDGTGRFMAAGGETPRTRCLWTWQSSRRSTESDPSAILMAASCAAPAEIHRICLKKILIIQYIHYKYNLYNYMYYILYMYYIYNIYIIHMISHHLISISFHL